MTIAVLFCGTDSDDFIAQFEGVPNVNLVFSAHSFQEIQSRIDLMSRVLFVVNGARQPDTLDCIDKVKKTFTNSEILVFRKSFHIDIIFQLIRGGVCGLAVCHTPTEVIQAATDIIREGVYLSPQVVKDLIKAFRRKADSPLSNREMEVMQLIARGKTYSKIAELLFISRTTAKTHIRNIYSKLDVKSKDEAIAKAASERLILSFGLI